MNTAKAEKPEREYTYKVDVTLEDGYVAPMWVVVRGKTPAQAKKKIPEAVEAQIKKIREEAASKS